MKEVILYQAVDAQNGIPSKPIYSSKAFFGSGYYFGIDNIRAAHWWGKKHYGANYIVCKALYDAHSEHCFDLVGNPAHIRRFRELAEELIRRSGNPHLTTAEVLMVMRKLEEFQIYWAVKAHPYRDNNKLNVSCSSDEYTRSRPMKIYLGDMMQMCVFDLEFLLNNQAYTAVSHSCLRDDYVV